jgi:NhaA family Na+:H+ antiporter
MKKAYSNTNFEFLYKMQERFGKKINPSIFFLAIAFITIIIANSPLRVWYESFCSLELSFGIHSFNFLSHGGHPISVLGFVNDALMAVFFFAVGLEIKREVLVGELSSTRQALLPVIAACGGMIFPVLFFLFTGKMQGLSPEELRGMAIPMATDIAFSLGVLSLLGKKAPIGLKIFLMGLAIVDDIGGILVIAIFYSHFSTASIIYLIIALVNIGVLFLGNRLRIHRKSFYIVMGITLWYCFLQGGIHPTIAGVIVAFLVPARPYVNIKKYTENLRRDLYLLESTIPQKEEQGIILSNHQIKYLAAIERGADKVISPLQDFEDNLHGLVNFFILPLFAFVNGGVVFNLGEISLLNGVSLPIMVGLILGKSIGIFTFTYLAIKSGISKMPSGGNWKSIFGIALLGGIGFTVSLFLASLSYPAGSALLNDAKIGIFAGSLISGFLGYWLLHRSSKKKLN